MFQRAIILAFALSATAATARADGDGGGDGIYGRFDADTTLSLGLGGGAAWPAGELRGLTALELRARYLDSAGLLVMPEWRVGEFGLVTFALDLRPLFPARFLLNRVADREWFDLLVDSIGVDVGAAVLPLDKGAGAAFSIAFGVDVPLVLPGDAAHGIFLRLWGRHLRAGELDLGAPAAGGFAEWSLGATLTIRTLWNSGLATRGD